MINKKSKKSSVLPFYVSFVFVIILMAKSVYFQFSAKLNNTPYLSVFNFKMLLGLAASAFLIIAFVLLFFKKKWGFALIILDLIFSILLLADHLYFRYYSIPLSILLLYQISLVPTVTASIISMLNLSDLLYFADLPLMIISFAVLKSKKRRSALPIAFTKRLVTFLILIFTSIILYLVPSNKIPQSLYLNNSNYVVSSLGITWYHIIDLKNYFSNYLFADTTLTEPEMQKIQKFYKSIPTLEQNEHTGAAEGKNIIIIQMEAIQSFVLGLKISGQEVTPNLNAFVNESSYFENFFYQIGGGNTSDAEYVVNTSMHALPQGALYYLYSENSFSSLANTAKKEGYDTYVYHANQANYWNRQTMYNKLGFSKYMSKEDYTQEDVLGMGISDKSFFAQSLSATDISKPFYGFFITLSSHHPFTAFESSNDFNVGKYEKTFIGNYLKAAHYADKAIGDFIKELKRQELYENSVIVLYGDHFAVNRDEASILGDFTDYADTELDWLMLQKTPCFIRYPNMDKALFGPNKKTVGEIDILPTVANILNWDIPYALGNDMLTKSKGAIILRNGTIITDDFVKFSSSNELISVKNTPLNSEMHKSTIDSLQKQLEISDLILRKNALSILP